MDIGQVRNQSCKLGFLSDESKLFDSNRNRGIVQAFRVLNQSSPNDGSSFLEGVVGTAHQLLESKRSLSICDGR